MEHPVDDTLFGLPNDLYERLRGSIDTIDWERELKRVGALSGSVIGSFVASRMSLSLGLRIVSVVGGSYGGMLAVAAAFEVWNLMKERD